MLLTQCDSGACSGLKSLSQTLVSVPAATQLTAPPEFRGIPHRLMTQSTCLGKAVINIQNSDPHPPKQGRYVLQISWKRDKKQRASGTEGDHPGAGKGEMEIAPMCLLHRHLVLVVTSRASTGKDGFCVLPSLASSGDHPIKTHRLSQPVCSRLSHRLVTEVTQNQ